MRQVQLVVAMRGSPAAASAGKSMTGLGAQGKKNGWSAAWPLVRGCRPCRAAESLVLGYKALEIAALHAFAEEGKTNLRRPRRREGLQLGTVLLALTVHGPVPVKAELASDLLPLGDGMNLD